MAAGALDDAGRAWTPPAARAMPSALRRLDLRGGSHVRRPAAHRPEAGGGAGQASDNDGDEGASEHPGLAVHPISSSRRLPDSFRQLVIAMRSVRSPNSG